MASLFEKFFTRSDAPKVKKESAPLPKKWHSSLKQIPIDQAKDLERYLHIFNQSPQVIDSWMTQLTSEGKADIQDFLKFAHPEDKKKFLDYGYLGKGFYDLTYRPESKKGKEAVNKLITHPVAQPIVGVSAGVANTAAGIAELGAALSDLTLDTDVLSVVEKALPAAELMDIYGDKAGSVAKFTSILVQYGLGWGIARKIAQKVIGKLAKRKLAQKTAGVLNKVKIPSLTGTKTGMDIARFGGYWVLPAAVGDAMVSTQANETMGDIFGKTEAEGGNKLQQLLMNSKSESLEGLVGKERAAAILRNKLKFGAEGTALVGGITLVGPSLKLAAKTTGKVLAGQQLPKSLQMGPITKIPGLADMTLGLGSKLMSAQTKGGIGIPGLFILAKKGWTKGMTKLGIPKREYWKFSDMNTFRRWFEDWIVAPLNPNWKFDKGSATAMRIQQNMVRKVKKNFDIWQRQMDKAMYGLVKAGFSDIAFNTRTSVAAMSYWDDVIKVLKGQMKIDKLPKSLRTGTRAIRQMIDDQTDALQPIIRDLDVREEMTRNIGKYLHTSYEIFKNSKWRASKEAVDEGIKYFMNLLRQSDPLYKNARKGSEAYKRLVADATEKVNSILAIGRREGTTPGMRLKEIMNEAAAIKVPANIFKDVKNIPDEIANLLGKVRDPKSIILDTLVEQAHTIHSFNAYRELARQGMGKWIFRNRNEYLDFVAKNNIVNPRTLKEIKVNKPYNMDLEGIFKNKDGSSMLAAPEMVKAISDQTLLVDQVLKLPFYKSLLAIKAATQINKTVLSLMTQMRNITTASSFAMANGHVGSGASVADNFEMLWKEMVGKTDNPEALRKILDEALEMGALDNSTIARELEDLIPELIGSSKVPNIKETAKNVIKKIRKGDATDIGVDDVVGKTVSDWKGVGPASDEIFERLLTNKGAIGKLVQKSIEAYQLGDNVWKLFGYQFTKSQLKPAFKTLDDVKKYFKEVEGFEWNPLKSGSLTAGKHGQNLKTLDDAIKEVSGLIIRDTYPNYSMVPRAVQTIRKIPFFGNFVGFTSEMWRNSYQILRRGTAEMASSNPYIRQMGARRLMGYMGTVGTLVPVAYETALMMTGIPKEIIEAYKQRFSPEFQKGHTLIPLSKQDEKTKKIKFVDADTLMPYSDVIVPFKLFMDNWNAGKKTDQSTLSLFANSMIDSTMKAIEPFITKAIWYETAQEVTPNDKGIAKTKNGSTIADWNNDIDPFSRTLYHIYSKMLPTTLKSGEKIWRAFNGQLSKSAVEFDPMDEVAATIAGFRMGEIDAFKSMKYKVGQITGELSNARKIFINRSISANVLMEDFNRIANGESPIQVPKNFNQLQKNRYRIWSEAWKDIEALRTIGYSENQIRSMIEGRRAFSKAELAMLMVGRYAAAKSPKLDSINGFTSMINEINRNKGTFYSPLEFLDPTILNDVYIQWNNIPLGKDLTAVEQEIGVPLLLRATEIQEDFAEYGEKILEQTKEEQQQIQEDMEKYQKRLWDTLQKKGDTSKNTAPIGTPPLKTEIFTASRVYPTISGSQVNQQTGLTGTQEALLSPTEKLIAKRQNEGLGSLA